MNKKAFEIAIKEKIAELRNKLDDISIDFFGDHDISDNYNIHDAISQYSDNNIDIYNYDLLEWLKGNYEFVEDAIDEYGAPDKFNIIEAIQMGQYYKNIQILNNEIDNIIKLFAYDFLFKSDFIYDAMQDDIFDLIDDALSKIDTNNEFYDISAAIHNIFYEN